MGVATPLAQLDALVAENTARLPLTRMEEARAFAEQMAAGRTQSEVAALPAGAKAMCRSG